MSKSNSVLVVGSIAFDDVETPFGKRNGSLGGSAIFFSIAASHFTNVRIVGVAGSDYPQEAIALLEKRNIDTRGLEIKEGKTFLWGGKYHEDINIRDTLYTNLNVFAEFNPKIPDVYKTTPSIFLGNIQPSLQLDVLNQVKNPKLIALDTMNLWINTAKNDLMKVLKKVDLILINNSELSELTGELNLLKGLKAIHGYGLKYVVIKKGEHGAILSDNGSLFYAPAFPVIQPTDPTGAGDSFAGGLIGYLSACPEISSNELKKSIIYGNIMGSFCVEHFSINGLLNLTKDMINSRYKSLQQLVTF